MRRFAAFLAAAVLAGVSMLLGMDNASAGTAGFLYASAYDTTHATSAFVTLTAETETNVQPGEHSLTEMAMVNGGMVAEIGITTDPALNGDSTPHLFTSTWTGFTGPTTNGWNGYNAASGFVHYGGLNAAGGAVAVGTKVQVGLEFYQGDLWVYANGWVGYFPGSTWGGKFTAAGYTTVYGECYYNGRNYPSMNGALSGYSSSTGGKLTIGSPSYPYAESNKSATGFTTSGGGFNG